MVKIKDKININKIIKKIIYVLFVLFLVYLVFELIRKIFFGSLGFEELVIALLVANLGYSFYINTKLSKHLGWYESYNKKF